MIDPEAPAVEAPLFSTTAPLAAADDDCMVTLPLCCDDEAPDVISMLPPAADVDSPASMVTLPPLPPVLEPAVKEIEPEVSADAPTESLISPDKVPIPELS